MPAQSYNGTYVPANWAGRGNCRRTKAPAVIARLAQPGLQIGRFSRART